MPLCLILALMMAHAAVIIDAAYGAAVLTVLLCWLCLPIIPPYCPPPPPS
jgi:hypothetical protein